MNVYLKTLGCRLNEAELQSWARDFERLGHAVVDNADGADVMVLNSCAVTAEAVRKSRQTARRMHRENPSARLVLSGCFATLESRTAAESAGVDLVVTNADKAELAHIAHRELRLVGMPSMATEPGVSALYRRGRERAFVKVQDGCRYRCTYCIVTLARGDERSRSIEELVAEVQDLCRGGIGEVVLTGVHVGGYGVDLGSSLAELVSSLLSGTDIPRLRFASVEPWDLPEGFFGLFADPRLMPHIHLPLQSGSDSVLRRMARRCKTQDFGRLVAVARSEVPDFNVTTDIIVGFPGETAAEWRETMEFVEHVGFGHVHIFPYSPRSGTKAAALPDPVPREIVRERCQQLAEVAGRMRRGALQALVGREFPVLWESGVQSTDGGEWRYGGYTPSFHRVSIESPGQLPIAGTIRGARITGVGDAAASAVLP